MFKDSSLEPLLKPVNPIVYYSVEFEGLETPVYTIQTPGNPLELFSGEMVDLIFLLQSLGIKVERKQD